MRKTVKQVSQELGISKPAVTQRMNAIENFRLHYTHKVGNRLEINEQGIYLLNNYSFKRHKSLNSWKSDDNNQLANSYLTEQISVKDKQIANLQKSLDKQQTLLDQQQQLQLAIVSENRQLKEKVRKLSDSIEISKTVNRQQINGKNSSLPNMRNPNDNGHINGNSDKNRVFKNNDAQKKIHKNASKYWWHFW